MAMITVHFLTVLQRLALSMAHGDPPIREPEEATEDEDRMGRAESMGDIDIALYIE